MIPMRMIPNDPKMTPLWRIAHGSANDPDPMEVLAKLKKAAVVLLEWYNKEICIQTYKRLSTLQYA